MLRNKGLSNKVLVLGIDGMDPRFSKAMIAEGKMPNLKKLVEMGAARNDLAMLGAMPTITPPLWATLATGCYPMTHGIIDYNVMVANELDMSQEGFFSKFLKTEPLWNITAESGKKTMLFHWPGGAWPPTSDSPNLMVIDGTSPGGLGNNSIRRDEEILIIATTKTEKGGFVRYCTPDSHVNCDISELKAEKSKYNYDFKDPRIDKYFAEYLEGMVFQDFVPDKMYVKNIISYDYGTVKYLADYAQCVSMSPITEPENWANAPADAKEFTIYYKWGKLLRPALILKNDGVYNQVAVYTSKESAEPLFVLDHDVYAPNCPDTVPYKGVEEQVVRNMRALEIAEDGSYVRMWASNAHSCSDNRVFYPQWIHTELTERFGTAPATSMVSGQDEDLILKCSHEQWKQCAKWQADCMQYMMDDHGVEVIFSHFHGPDLSGHSYMKYLKNRETSKVDESVVREWHVNTYKWTDDYIGSFMHYLDDGWTILVVSDHSLICPKHEPNRISDNSGVNVGVMKDLGYTVLKKDENGNEIEEIDWSKTRAIQTRSNSIYVNLKGRNPYGIVDPADKYELEEQIITDLYGYKDKKTGKRIVALALHNKDAVLLGMGGEYAADIIILIHEDYNFDHGDSMSTACGHNDTCVGPIFAAAGSGIKPGYEVKGWIREVDVAPTVAVLLGVDIPVQCEGAPMYQIFTERM